jgi:single-strand DNA-binding protein
MNKVMLMGRLTKDPEVRYTGGESMAVARYTLAVNRRYKKNSDKEADFISCVTFGRSAEFAEKYLRKGMKIAVIGRISTGSYKDKEGNTRYTTDIIVDEHEFAESKGEKKEVAVRSFDEDDFLTVPEGEELPFT